MQCFFLRIRLASTRIQRIFRPYPQTFLKTLSRVEIFLSDTNTYTCGRSYPQICEYAYVIFLDPVFTSSIINKHSKVVSSLLIALISRLISCVQINAAVINLHKQCFRDPSRFFWRIASFFILS